MTDSSMLKYQYDTILDQLILFQLHAEDPNCPCSLRGPKPGEIGEWCEPKHLRAIVALARETVPMEEDSARLEHLDKIVLEGTELFKKMEKKLCEEEIDLGDYVTWARDVRKPVEEFCYTTFCDITPQEDEISLQLNEKIAQLFAKKKKEEPRWCHPVQETSTELQKLTRTLSAAKKRIAEIKTGLEMPLNICRGQAEMFETADQGQEVIIGTGVLDPYGSRCRDPETGQWTFSEACGVVPAGITTTALGVDGITQYEFEFKIMDLENLIVSHDPFTFVPNPDYPQELQPRLRERAATKVQVEKIAANLEPEAVITDFHVIDRGAPIIGPDSVVEAGNGRVMGIIRAAVDYPEKYEAYRQALRDRARDYGMSPKDVDATERPVLVRLRISDVDRTEFTQEANQAATIAPSAIENARTDAQKITLGMLQELDVGEDESIEDALRSTKNLAFAKRFLATLPEVAQAALVDAQGRLNRDGVHRMAMAIFVSAFQGDAGLRLAEKAFESLSVDVRNVINAIARSLGLLAEAEALTRAGDRDPSLSIGDDLAQTVNVFSAIKRNPALTVEKYLAQEQMFARELTPFQEDILVVLENLKGSPRKLARILRTYAAGVISSPPPAQAALIPGAEVTKEGLWASAVSMPEEQPALMEVIKVYQEACELSEVAELFKRRRDMDIEQFADDYVLPELKEYPGDRLSLDEIERLLKKREVPAFTREDLERVLTFLEAGGEIISFKANNVKPKCWAVLGENLYAPSMYLTRKFGDEEYIFYKHEGSDREAMKLVNQIYDNWKVLAVADSGNDIWVSKKDAALLIDPEFLRSHGELHQGLIAGIAAAGITGVGIGLGFKFVDWLAARFSKRRLEQSPYAQDIPSYIDVFKTTIAKHYRPTEDFHEGSIRVVKPVADILVYLGCLKTDSWDAEKERCDPNPTVVKTIVPNNEKYREDLDHLLKVHPEIKVNYREKELGVEPIETFEQEELELVGKALDNAEEV